MSYYVARKVDQEEPATAEHGMSLPEIDFEDRDKNTIDLNEDEVLDFVLSLVARFDELAEGEALVVWKEVF